MHALIHDRKLVAGAGRMTALNEVPNALTVETQAESASVLESGSDARQPNVQPVTPPTDAGQAGSKPVVKPPYPPAASEPTQVGAEGIRFDFNLGARVVLPVRKSGSWRVRLRDLDTGNILFESKNKGALVGSAKRWYVRFLLEVWSCEENSAEQQVLRHEFSAHNRDLLIQFPIGTLGDVIAWLPYAIKFRNKHNCRLTCAMGELLIPIFRDAYPDIIFVTHDAVDTSIFYATYSMGLFFDDTDGSWQPCDFRLVGLHRTAGYILGVDPTEDRPRLSPDYAGRPIAEPYVCIGVQSTSYAKYWANPHGWRDVIAALKMRGYRVICIDQKPIHGHGLVWTQIPHGAEDETGDRPLTERVNWLKHAAFFVGLSSGLSWLAWAAGTPVVLISGFTHPVNEFETPYRVINYHTCNSCWNDPRLRFDHMDFLWCPRLAGTDRQFECTRLITAEQVIAAIAKIPN